MSLPCEKRIFIMDRISHQLLGVLSKQVEKTMSEVVVDSVELLSRLMFCHKCDLGLQFDHRFDPEIYQCINDYYFYVDDPKMENEFREKLEKIKKKAEEIK